MLTVVTTAIMPIILNVAVGFLLAKRGLLDHRFLRPFSTIVFRFFIPCLLFSSIYRAEITFLRLAQYWSGYFVPILVLFAVAAIVAKPLFALTTVYANTVMVGIPLVIQTWGSRGLDIAVAVISLNSLTLFLAYALSAAILGRDGPRGRMFTEIGKTLTNPIILSLIVGATLNLLHIPIYGPLIESVALPGRAALPASLLILGANLAGFPLRISREHQGQVFVACFCKLLMVPAGVYFFAGSVLQLHPVTTGVLVLLAACPSGINSLPFAHNSNSDQQMISTAIFISTLSAVVTLPFWVYLVR